MASARPCVSNKKSARPAWQLCQALDGYSLSLPKRSINRSASNLDRIKNQAIAKQSGYVHTTSVNVRTPSQFIYCAGSACPQIAEFRRFLYRFVQVREPLGESVDRAMRRSVGAGHRSPPPISHVIRWSDKLGTSRKPQNSNDVDSKVERVAGELRARLRWGVVLHEGLGCQGFRVVELCAAGSAGIE